MSDHRAFPADGFDTGWTTWDQAHREHLTLRWENEAWTATGRVGREQIEYVIRLSPLWHIRQFMLFRDLDEPDLWLGTDGQGRWGEINGAHRTELDGALDLALPCTPFSHTLPIRRHPLLVGDSVELTVIEVDVETLATTPIQVTYTRTGRRDWLRTREGSAIGFSVDEHAIANDIDGHFRRQPAC